MNLREERPRIRLIILLSLCFSVLPGTVPAATEVEALYGRMDHADVVGVWWADSWNTGNGRVPYVGALTAIDYREDRFVSGELVLGGRLEASTSIAPWIGLAVSGGFSQTRQEDGEYDSTWSAGLIPEIGIYFRIGESWGCRLSGRYLISTEGRDRDFWVGGFGIQWGN